MSHGFPNCMHIGAFIGNAVSANFTGVFLRYAERIAQIVRHVKDSKKTTIEPSEEAQQDWVNVVHECFDAGKDFFAECTPGYYNAEGKAESKEALTHDVYSPGIYEFEDIVGKWISRGLPGVVVR